MSNPKQILLQVIHDNSDVYSFMVPLKDIDLSNISFESFAYRHLIYLSTALNIPLEAD